MAKFMRHSLGNQSDKNISGGQNVGLQEVSGDQGDDRYRLQKRVGGVTPLLFGRYDEFFRDKDGSYSPLYRVARLILPSALYYTWNAFLDFQCDDLPPSVTLKQVAEHTNKNLRTIELNVQRLRQLGYLYTRHAPRDGMCVVEKCFDGFYKAVVEYLEWEKSASYIPPLREFFAIDQLDWSICNQLVRFNNYRRLIHNKKPGPKPKKVHVEEECVNGVFREIAEEVISLADNSSLPCAQSFSLSIPEKEVQQQKQESEQDEGEQGIVIEKVVQQQEFWSKEDTSTQNKFFIENNGQSEIKEPYTENVPYKSEERPLELIELNKLPGLYMSAKLMNNSTEEEVQMEEDRALDMSEDSRSEVEEDQVVEEEEALESEEEEDQEPEKKEEQRLLLVQGDEAPALSTSSILVHGSSEEVHGQGICESSLQEGRRTVLSSHSSSLKFLPNIRGSLYRKTKKRWVIEGVVPYYTDLEWQRVEEISNNKDRLVVAWNKFYEIRDKHLDTIKVIDKSSGAFLKSVETRPATKPWLEKRLRELNEERDFYLAKIRELEENAEKAVVEAKMLTKEAFELVSKAGRRVFKQHAKHCKKHGFAAYAYRKIGKKGRATGLFLPIRFVRDKPIIWNAGAQSVMKVEGERYSKEQQQNIQEYRQPSQERPQDRERVEEQACCTEKNQEGRGSRQDRMDAEEQVCSSIEEGDHKEQPHEQIKKVIGRTAHEVVSLRPVGVHIQLEQLVVEKQLPPENEATGQQTLPETSILADGHILEISKKEPEGQQKDIPEPCLQGEVGEPPIQKRGRRDRRRGAQKEEKQGELGVTLEKQAGQVAVNDMQGIYTVAENGGLKGFLFDVTSPEAWIKAWQEHPEMIAKVQNAVHTAQAAKLGADDAERQKKGEPLLNCSDVGPAFVSEAYIHAYPSEPLQRKWSQ